jgi:hypothetical protein
MEVLSLSISIFFAATKVIGGHIFQFDAHVFGNHLSAGQQGDVTQHGLAPVTEAGCFHSCDFQCAVQFVDYQGGQGFAFDILGDDHHRLALLGDFFQQRKEIFHFLS